MARNPKKIQKFKNPWTWTAFSYQESFHKKNIQPEFWNVPGRHASSQCFFHRSNWGPVPPIQTLTRSSPNWTLWNGFDHLFYNWTLELCVTCKKQTSPDIWVSSPSSETHSAPFAQTLNFMKGNEVRRIGLATFYMWTTWIVFQIVKVLIMCTQYCFSDLLQCQRPFKYISSRKLWKCTIWQVTMIWPWATEGHLMTLVLLKSRYLYFVKYQNVSFWPGAM